MSEEERFIRDVNLVVALDHSGRGGNGFFLTLFDQHPEVLTCPWMHYSYSYLVTEFGDPRAMDSRKVHEVWPRKSYFRFVYNDLDEKLSRQLTAFGGDIHAPLDRALVRKTFDSLILAKPTISSRELIAYTYLAYAKGAGRSLASVKYILVSDAVSLRFENPLGGFSGRVVDAILADFPAARIFALVRDPRATFSSCRHQFVNSNGNMYGVKPGNAFKKLIGLFRVDLTPDDCAFLYWFLYFAAAARTAFRLRAAHSDAMIFLKNEDLNLNFLPTMAAVCARLGIAEFPAWRAPDYKPTMVGRAWRGTGAYNNRYQPNKYGLLKNDSDAVADKVTGPNAYVTERWRARMAPREIRIVEHLFKEEMAHFGYAVTPPARGPAGPWSTAFRLLFPFLGELPSLRWILEGRHVGSTEVTSRLFYALLWAPYYAASRFTLIRKILVDRFFGLETASAGPGSVLAPASWVAAPAASGGRQGRDTRAGAPAPANAGESLRPSPGT